MKGLNDMERDAKMRWLLGFCLVWILTVCACAIPYLLWVSRALVKLSPPSRDGLTWAMVVPVTALTMLLLVALFVHRTRKLLIPIMAGGFMMVVAIVPAYEWVRCVRNPSLATIALCSEAGLSALAFSLFLVAIIAAKTLWSSLRENVGEPSAPE